MVAGIADAVLPAAWSRLARDAGARVIRIRPESYLHIVLVTRTTPLTPAAAFVRAAEDYVEQNS